VGGQGGDLFGGLAASFAVGVEDIVDGSEFGAGGAGQDAVDDLGDAEEREAIFEEGGDGDFVGGVESGGIGATFFHGFAGEAEAGETARGGLFEIEAAEGGPIELDLL